MQLNEKKIKTIRLKVYPESVVKISAPYSINDEFLMEFVSKRQKWIEDKLEKFSKTKLKLYSNVKNASCHTVANDCIIDV